MSETPESQKNALDQVMGGDNGPHNERIPASKEKKRTGASVFTYLAIMFAAAFLMLLLAYFIQQRNNDAAISGLQSSLDQFQSMDELMDENRTLREENKALEEKNDSLQKELDTVKDELDEEKNIASELEDNNSSWMYFYTIDALYQAEQYEDCAQRIKEIQATPYYATPNIAYARAQEIANGLLELGYLDENAASLLTGNG